MNSNCKEHDNESSKDELIILLITTVLYGLTFISSLFIETKWIILKLSYIAITGFFFVLSVFYTIEHMVKMHRRIRAVSRRTE